MSTSEQWDIFCRVVDNFGDAGVCWRLARQLALEQGGQVRLWIDDLESLQRLHPDVARVERQIVEAVNVRHWRGGMPDAPPGDFVIDAFGCGLPDAYVASMATKAGRAPLWIVLEYLTAEPWAREHHGMPSPHPRLPLERYFFFPGFVQGTGGLLRERDLFARRDAFTVSKRDAFWHSVGHISPPADATTVSMFSYESAPLAELFRCWESGSQKVVAAIPEGSLLPLVLTYFGASAIPPGRVLRRGALEARIVPFVPQAHYDELLWSCDCNFVRGEDSFVRAQWAARPFVWHIYPQQDRAHWRKLEAFLDLYCPPLSAAAGHSVKQLMQFWNQIDAAAVSPASAWAAFMTHRDELRRYSRVWPDKLAAIGSLADNLASFCRDKLK
jgi:uncharacterized repeat protein (TIGR03837 family)